MVGQFKRDCPKEKQKKNGSSQKANHMKEVSVAEDTNDGESGMDTNTKQLPAYALTLKEGVG